MKEIIVSPQTCDMGSGYGYLDKEGSVTLTQVLDFYEKYGNCWGTITIYQNNEIIRKFDYDVYHNSEQFYHQLGHWQYKEFVEKVEFEYCHMNKDINIYLK